MDRYKLEIVNNHGDRYIRCDPAPDGSWVMFRDVAALQKRCEEAERERDALRRDTSQQVTTDEMVRRLQHLGDWQAADRIEALQKRVAELEDFCEDYLVMFELFHITNTKEAPEDATGFLAEKARAILGAALEGEKDE